MDQLQAAIEAVDQLSSADLQRLQEHIQQCRHQGWIIPAENIAKMEQALHPVHEEAALMTDEEIDAAIDEAIAEVRNAHKQKQA